MKRLSLLLALVAAELLHEAARAGTLRGTVRLPAGVDPARSPAVVYVDAATAPSPEPAPPIVVDQRGIEFVPRVQAMPLGATIRFRNSDREAHNVNSQTGCCAFNLMVLPDGEAEIRPRRPGVVRLLCSIHQQMRGFVVVSPTTLFAMTDRAGQFTIEGVPDGEHKIVVWQEHSRALERDIEVGGETWVELELTPSGEPTAAARPPAVRQAMGWQEVVKAIEAKLDQALLAATEPAGGREADRLVLDAYFEHFEASELETAVRLYRGDDRAFDIEQMFAQIRRPLLENLAAGRSDPEPVRVAVRGLVAVLEEEVRNLEAKGIPDRTALASPVAARAPAGRVVEDPQAVLRDLRAAFVRVEGLAASDPAGAAAALADAYFQVFHRIEPALAAHNFVGMRQIEGRFLDLRGRLGAGMATGEAARELAALYDQIEQAAGAIETTGSSRGAAMLNTFSNAFLILAREGVEALLIVSALLLYLNRIGQPSGKGAIYAGVWLALAATAVTWSLLQWVIVRSGVAQETIEGIATLVAGGVLFYVSYWLLSRAEARHWQAYLTRQVGRGISTGSRVALAAMAFLAVYREGAETILMLQPLLVRPGSAELAGLVAGASAAGAVLAITFWALRFAAFRMAIRPFFRITGGMLFLLAVVFSGKGVMELQEAGLLANTPLQGALRAGILSLPAWFRDALGLGATVQSLAIQTTLLAGAALSLGAVWCLSRVAHIQPPISAVNQSAA